MRDSTLRLAVLLAAWLGCAGARAAQPRLVIGLAEGWLFRQGPAPGEAQSTAFDDSAWTVVSIPHTWNRIGNEGLKRSPESNSYRGASWYRLHFPTPATLKGRRAFLQFDGVGAVADVWLNGRPIGRHEGAFSRFRFDVTDALNPRGENLLAVKADNSKPQPGSLTEHVIPLAGDFFVSGGLYRNVSLILTGPVHVDMADFGGPGVYGRALELEAERALVSISRRIANDAPAARNVTVVTKIEDASGQVVASEEKRARLAAGETSVLTSALGVDRPRLWRGVTDPYLYRIVVAIRSGNEQLDEVTQPLGLRTLAFDPDKGFFLNGEPLPLVGASMHQDRPVKGWAVARADRVQDFDLLQEMGGNAVRLAHYQHDQVAYELADARGIVAWAEIPLVSDVSFDGSRPGEALAANARQQLNELIRQNFNHPSIAVWSIGNEVDLRTTGGRRSRPGALLRSLHALAKELDPSRLTTLADCCEETTPTPERDVIAGITDTLGYNRYFGWYYGKFEELGPYLDAAHARHPRLPIAVSEYGAGAGLTQHTDNALGGPVDSHGRPHPEELQMLFHEESWRQIRERPYLWGVFIWNLFDFASDERNEGDLTDINEKGMVSYDRATRKDVFYFYEANWSRTPALHLVGRRYIERAYPVVDVKAYSNASQVRLSLNGNDIGTAPCSGGICIWPRVRLAQGVNHIAATADFPGASLHDSLQWNYAGSPTELHIKAGDLSGYVAPDGTRYGSDNFFIGGESRGINAANVAPAQRLQVTGTSMPALYESYRSGAFAYELPLPDGEYVVTARFIEPTATAAGKRVFDVVVNGHRALPDVDPFALAGGSLKAVDRSFKARAAGGRLRIEFRPRPGNAAIVSALDVTSR